MICSFVQMVIDDLDAGRYQDPRPWGFRSVNRFNTRGDVMWSCSDYMILASACNKKVRVELTIKERWLLHKAMVRMRKRETAADRMAKIAARNI